MSDSVLSTTASGDPEKDLEETGSTAKHISDAVHVRTLSAAPGVQGHRHSRDDENPFFVRDLEYTKAEEVRVVRILDTRLFPWILLTTFVLNMDRTNNSNAISDNLPADLGFNINVVNTATALYSVLFSVSCFSGAVFAKIAGPSRCMDFWIPILMFSWGLVTMAHALIKNESGYLSGSYPPVIAITEGGVIPATLVYMGGFYKSTELATRLAWFWGVQSIASAISGLMASGLLQLQGVAGLFGWKWLFLIDGIITVVVAVLTWFYLPVNASRTGGGLRGFKPWFDERQVHIAVTRVVRDDPAKRMYEYGTSLSIVTWTDVKDSVLDLGLWGHMFITAIGLTPTTPLSTYLPTVIRSFNFDVVRTSVPVVSENQELNQKMLPVCCERTYRPTVCAFLYHIGANDLALRSFARARATRHIWCHMAARWLDIIACTPRQYEQRRKVNTITYFAACVVQSWPSTHPLNIAWMSENTGSVGKRTIASGAVIGFANIYGTWGSQIYKADDSPNFRRGNTINIVFAGTATVLWVVQKYYYKYRNARNAKRFAALSDAEREREELEMEQKGNRSVTFHFTT
ncbi:hypothetical protein EW145_g7359 [Phellinidium pouzarii]|uniref:Major facilitator superfamily (MFS) profile domain-containing protein n=1 Tax=Phellinidium pouzarii TaxID=167371 RepID=A0A4S4KK92_9AGAM|nr:hypothetical protein EW145_g7359 [Phellinidium pouzarii]